MHVQRKRCPQCCETLDADKFYTNKRVKDGLAAYCKVCQNSKTKLSREKYKERVLEKARQNYHSRHWADNLIYGSKSSAKKRGLEHNITVEHLKYLWHIQEGNCYWLGFKLGNNSELPNRHPSKVSLDRLNPDIGYVKGNVVLTSSFANMGRAETSELDFRQFLDDKKLSAAYNKYK